jgi:hypothetical protein
MDELDELYGIRQQVSPEDYVAGLRNNLAVYKRQLASVLAEIDLFVADMTLTPAMKVEITEPMKRNARSLDWRVHEIERRLRQTAEVAMGLKTEEAVNEKEEEHGKEHSEAV